MLDGPGGSAGGHVTGHGDAALERAVVLIRRLSLFVGAWNVGVTFLFAVERSIVGMAIWMCLAMGSFSAYLYLLDDGLD